MTTTKQATLTGTMARQAARTDAQLALQHVHRARRAALRQTDRDGMDKGRQLLLHAADAALDAAMDQLAQAIRKLDGALQRDDFEWRRA